MPSLSRRAYYKISEADSWEEIWEAGPYFDRISTLLENAENYAIFAGWQIDSRLPLKNPKNFLYEPLKQKVIRLCDEKPNFKVYFLLWDHAYFYVFERETWQGRVWENVHPKVHFVFDNRHWIGGSHHEKVAIIDGKVALCGGIDLCDGRLDSVEHYYFDCRRSLDRFRESHGPYHDLAVQVTGEICCNIHSHLTRRWEALSSIPFPKVELHSSVGTKKKEALSTVYLSRTMVDLGALPGRTCLVREVEFLFRDLIGLAQKRIILEGQYYWSNIINKILINKIRSMKGKEFEIYLILSDLCKVKSFSNRMMPFELKLLEELDHVAREEGVRLVIGFPSVNPQFECEHLTSRAVYIHSKVIVIDDCFLGVGSANFASRALRIDTEIHLTLEAKSSLDRMHIENVATFILDHWRLNACSNSKETRSNIQIQNFEDYKKDHPLSSSSWFPWEKFFDPELPWFYRLKRNYRRMAQRRWFPFIYSLTLIWILIVIIVCFAVQISWIRNPRLIYSLIVLSAVWLLPISFFITQLLIVLGFGYPEGSKIVVLAFWIAAILGYGVARSYPQFVTYYSSQEVPKWLPERLGLRSFPILMSILLDPRVSFRSKFIYQGLYCIPLPWFVLGTGVILPSILSMVTRAESYFIVNCIPDRIVAPFKMHLVELLLGILLFGCFKFFRSRMR